MWGANIQYNDDYKRSMTASKEKINKEINKELKKEKVDKKRIMQLEQAKLLAPLFNDMFGYGDKFRLPY